MDENNRNFILAIVLSLAVLLAWQYFFAVPKVKEQQARKQAEQSQPTAPPGAPHAPARPDAAPMPTPPAPPKTRADALAATARVAIDTASLKGSIALVGGRIDDLVLKKYRKSVKRGSDNVVLFSPAGVRDAYFAEYGWLPDEKTKIKLPGPATNWQVEKGGDLKPGSPVTLVWDNGEGLIFRRTISVDNDYLFTVVQQVENTTGAPITIYPFARIVRIGTPAVQSYYILHEGLIGLPGADARLEEVDYDDVVKARAQAFPERIGGWLGITDKYWAAVIVPNQDAPYLGHFRAISDAGPVQYHVDYQRNGVTVPPGGSKQVKGLLFAGAKEVDIIDGYASRHGIAKFDLLIDWGWFRFLTKPLFYALDYFYKLVGNFGLAILIVTVLIKLALFPLANKSYVSMSKMKKLQPEMNRIKERFAEDRTRQQQALMELYKKEKVNPASGCLPILIQIPVFFALYKVLFITIEMRHAPFYGWIKDLSAPDPTNLFTLFGLIPWDPSVLPAIGAFLHLGVWPLIMGVTMLVQMRLNPAPPDPTQAMIFNWMPVIFTFLLATFPAGLVIYWAWNNLLSIIQQAYIMHRQGVEIALWENLGLSKKKQAGGSKS